MKDEHSKVGDGENQNAGDVESSDPPKRVPEA